MKRGLQNWIAAAAIAATTMAAAQAENTEGAFFEAVAAGRGQIVDVGQGSGRFGNGRIKWQQHPTVAGGASLR